MSGKEAIQMIQQQNQKNGGYRLILMDCLMPEMNGWETTIEILSLYEQNQIRLLPSIIAYSAFDSQEDINKSYQSGMLGHLSKPCTLKELCTTLNKWIRDSE